MLESLSEPQRIVVTSTVAKLAVVAAAGSGKTRVLTRRIAWQCATGYIDPRRVLAVTFTRKAAGELAQRLAQLGVRGETAGTFHAMALAQLRRRWVDRRMPVPHLLDRPGRVVAAAVETACRRHHMPAPVPAIVAEVARELDWARAHGIGADAYPLEVRAAGRVPPLAPELIAATLTAYEHEKRSRGVVDFHDLVERLADALETDREFAAAQRWRYRHLFVDEFQDLTRVQFRVLSSWMGDATTLTVVGDDRQSIYSFTGSDSRYLLDFPTWTNGGEVLRLETNYRSSPQILAAASSVLPRPAPAVALAAAPAAEPTGAADGAPGDHLGGSSITAARADGPVPTLIVHPDEHAEARAIARTALEANRAGHRWSAMAVLVRTNAQARPLRDALHAAGVPTTAATVAPIVDDADVATVLRETRAAMRTAPGARWATILAERLTDDDGPRLVPGRAVLLGTLVEEYLAADGGDGSLDGFCDFLRAARPGEDDLEAGSDAVAVMTFHRAKGLEWPIVFVAGLEDGFVPISWATSTAERDEEARLLYVALTRAEHMLHCSYAERRELGGAVRQRVASPWLPRLRSTLVGLGGQGERPAAPETAAERGVDAARSALATSRARLKIDRRPTPRIDDPCLAALQRWRRSQARAARVDPTVVIGDSVLSAIAAEPPHDLDGLIALGVGTMFARTHGETLLGLLAEAHSAERASAGAP